MQETAGLEHRRYRLGGLHIDALRRDDLIHIFDDAVAQRTKSLVLHHNLHSLYLYETVEDVRALYKRADWTYIDGMPVVWLARAAGLPVRSEHRTTFLDCFEQVIQHVSQRGWRVFYLGGTEQVLREGLALLRKQNPGLQMAGRNGFFGTGTHESAEVIAEINGFRPDILLVGMGMPLQERWIAQHYAELDTHVVLTCGATLSYVTGHSYRPPAWASTFGLYGLLRLCSEPRRLWRRYMVEPLVLSSHLIPRVVRQRLGRGLK